MKWIVAFALADQRYSLYPLEGGKPRPISGWSSGDVPIQWSIDGRSLYVQGPELTPAKIYHFDLTTGHREFWKELLPSDPTGVWAFGPVLITPDAKHYVYCYFRELNDLYLADGLK